MHLLCCLVSVLLQSGFSGQDIQLDRAEIVQDGWLGHVFDKRLIGYTYVSIGKGFHNEEILYSFQKEGKYLNVPNDSITSLNYKGLFKNDLSLMQASYVISLKDTTREYMVYISKDHVQIKETTKKGKERPIEKEYKIKISGKLVPEESICALFLDLPNKNKFNYKTFDFTKRIGSTDDLFRHKLEIKGIEITTKGLYELNYTGQKKQVYRLDSNINEGCIFYFDKDKRNLVQAEYTKLNLFVMAYTQKVVEDFYLHPLFSKSDVEKSLKSWQSSGLHYVNSHLGLHLDVPSSEWNRIDIKGSEKEIMEFQHGKINASICVSIQRITDPLTIDKYIELMLQEIKESKGVEMIPNLGKDSVKIGGKSAFQISYTTTIKEVMFQVTAYIIYHDGLVFRFVSSVDTKFAVRTEADFVLFKKGIKFDK